MQGWWQSVTRADRVETHACSSQVLQGSHVAEVVKGDCTGQLVVVEITAEEGSMKQMQGHLRERNNLQKESQNPSGQRKCTIALSYSH